MPYKLEELKSKSLNELLELFAFAEVITKELTDLAKLRESIVTSQPNAKAKSMKQNVTKDQLKSLTSHLDQIEQMEFDEYGRFIGDGAIFDG
jgi:uncharacterized protein YktB (UPF0637 family)